MAATGVGSSGVTSRDTTFGDEECRRRRGVKLEKSNVGVALFYPSALIIVLDMPDTSSNATTMA